MRQRRQASRLIHTLEKILSIGERLVVAVEGDVLQGDRVVVGVGLDPLDAAITALINASDAAQGSFKGAAVFLHGDGSGTDGYASWSTDWWWFGRYWLAAW